VANRRPSRERCRYRGGDVRTCLRDRGTPPVRPARILLEYDPAYLGKALAKSFPGRTKIIDTNVRAVKLTYDFVRDTFRTQDFHFRLVPEETSERRLLVNGNQAVALGKLAAGMTFQTYYPISPATDESVYLEAHETFPAANGEEGSVIIVQTEDELAAVTMASGAALTGARSATATSGPGFSLMAEGLGWAGINEVPLVVTLYQRGGPATSLPTRSEQGDLQFAIHAGHGEFPRIVMASGDITEAFYDAAQAFNYAERYQMLVIPLLDKALASTTQTVRPFDVEAIRIERGEVHTPPNGGHSNPSYTRFAPTAEKLNVYGDRSAAFTIVSWGSNKGGILEALERLAADGIAARLVQVRLLWPFPTDELLPLLADAAPLVVVELNFSGQFAQLLREQTGRASDYLVVKYNGRPMSGQELHRALRDIHAGTSEPRVVLRNPYE
jgi:2-oxoglutarate ferredoxin oxidoreductase subunit alpha